MVLTKFAPVLSVLAALSITVSTQAQEASAYVIADSTTGFVLESSNGQKKLPIASLTKIATAMVVLDWSAASKVGLNELATVPGQCRAPGRPPRDRPPAR